MNNIQLNKDGCRFRVWAPEKQTISLKLQDHDKPIPMIRDPTGYFQIDVPKVGKGVRYQYQIDNTLYPDPASMYQPEGVYGPSEIVDHAAFRWSDETWCPKPLNQLIIYELHVGTFTPEGTFEAIIPRLSDLIELGINAIELMPIAATSGTRNWGYDGALPYAVQNTYGGPDGLKKLIDACHSKNIAVILDVVYNHIGREGSCLDAFGPYFTDQYQTPWGKAINYDGAWCDGVRDFITGNAVYWAEHYHIDGLRLDAIHEIYDRNATTIWDELYTKIKDCEQRTGRRCYLIAESDTNDPKAVRPPETGGKGFDAQWMDDFHHALYVLLHPQGQKNYKDFGTIEQLAKAWSRGFVHSGEYVQFRHRRHGASSAGISGEHFIVFNQNHDLPGNRPGGERLSMLVKPHTLKLAAAAVLLSPYIPLLFMGEEYGADTPFYFFSDYQEPATTQNLLEGRKQQFASFQWDGDVRDPQDEACFKDSKLRWEDRRQQNHRTLLDWYKKLIHLRKTHPLLTDLTKNRLRADVIGDKCLLVYRYSADLTRHLLCLFNFSHNDLLSVDIGYAGAQTYVSDAGAQTAENPAPKDAVWYSFLSSPDLPATIPFRGTLELPPQAIAVYELNPSPVSGATEEG